MMALLFGPVQENPLQNYQEVIRPARAVCGKWQSRWSSKFKLSFNLSFTLSGDACTGTRKGLSADFVFSGDKLLIAFSQTERSGVLTQNLSCMSLLINNNETFDKMILKLLKKTNKDRSLQHQIQMLMIQFVAIISCQYLMSKIQIKKNGIPPHMVAEHLMALRHSNNIMQMMQEIRQINQLKRQSLEAERFQSQGKQTLDNQCFRNGTICPSKAVLCNKDTLTHRKNKLKKLDPINITENDTDELDEPIFKPKIEVTPYKKNSKSHHSLQPLKKYSRQGSRRTLKIDNIAKNSEQPRVFLPSLKRYESTLERFRKNVEPLIKSLPKKSYMQPVITKAPLPVRIVAELQQKLTGWSQNIEDDKIILIRQGLTNELMR